MVDLEEGFEFDGIPRKSGDVIIVTIPKKIFEYFKLKVGKIYHFIIKEKS